MISGSPVLLAAALAVLISHATIAQTPRGRLLIVGGGESPPELARRFVELAGGPGRARIAVIPMASGEPRETGDEKVAELLGLGAAAWVELLTRDQALDGASARTLDSATGVWFSGGDQSRLTAILGGTPVLAALHDRYRSGAVLGGTSAGAAIMSDSMVTGNQRRPDSLGYYGDEFPAVARGTIEVAPGFGFLPGTIVDQHFLKRERHNRLLGAVLERPTLIGVGIDEGTALEVTPDGQWRVLGASAVAIYDARRADITPLQAPLLGARGIRLHLLPAGSRYDPSSGVATLPPR
jgi:cyanophycinase